MRKLSCLPCVDRVDHTSTSFSRRRAIRFDKPESVCLSWGDVGLMIASINDLNSSSDSLSEPSGSLDVLSLSGRIRGIDWTVRLRDGCGVLDQFFLAVPESSQERLPSTFVKIISAQ